MNFSNPLSYHQGGAASALFIIYLATILKQAKQKLSENDQAIPLHLKDHTYTDQDHLSFKVDHQYADDISWASTSNKKYLENIEKKPPQQPSVSETYLLMIVKLRNTPLRETDKMTGETANLWEVN